MRGERRGRALRADLCSGKGKLRQESGRQGARHLVWHSELSIHSLTQQPGITVTLWVWHSTFALTSWPPVTAAADRLGRVRARGRLEGGRRDGDDWEMREDGGMSERLKTEGGEEWDGFLKGWYTQIENDLRYFNFEFFFYLHVQCSLCERDLLLFFFFPCWSQNIKDEVGIILYFSLQQQIDEINRTKKVFMSIYFIFWYSYFVLHTTVSQIQHYKQEVAYIYTCTVLFPIIVYLVNTGVLLLLLSQCQLWTTSLKLKKFGGVVRKKWSPSTSAAWYSSPLEVSDTMLH